MQILNMNGLTFNPTDSVSNLIFFVIIYLSKELKELLCYDSIIQ